MYDLAMKLKSSNHMVEALCLLNYLLSNSPSNFHAKLLCLQLYHRIGCVLGAHNTYNSLGFKFIQLHSMGYLHCARLATSGLYSVAREVYDTTTKFYNNFFKEGHEFISMCYKFGSFSKLEEFMEFQYNLTHSFHYHLMSWDINMMDIICLTPTTCEQILNAFRNGGIEYKIDEVDLIDLKDNRDLSVIQRWDPNANETKYNDEIYLHDLQLLRIRWALVKMVVLSIETINKDSKLTETNAELLEMHVKKWTEIFANARKIRQENNTTDEYLVNQLPSRLHGQLDMPYETIVRGMAELILSLEHRSTEAIDVIHKRIEQQLKQLCQMLCKTIEDYNAEEDRLWNRRVVQDTMGMGTEVNRGFL